MKNIHTYAGVSESWGLGFGISFEDRSIAIHIIKFYIGIKF